MKILISAYGCRPNTGSEPGVGWNWATQAARYHDVWVMTEASNRPFIERELAVNPRPNLHFVYHKLPELKVLPHRLLIEYHSWQWTALARARELEREVGFDLAHHLTIGGMRFPTFLARLGVPYLLGPVSGAERGPRSFYPSFGLRGATWEIVRDLTGAIIGLNPFVRASYRQATKILASSEQTLAALPSWAQGKAQVMTQNGVNASDSVTERPPREPGRFNVMYAGRLLPWKGVRLAIKAFAAFHATHPEARFTIAGDGPDLEPLRAMAAQSNASAAIDFRGEVPHDEVMNLYQTHDVFLYPCFHLSAIAMLEAMDAGLPIVGLDVGDARVHVTEDCGVLVPVRSPGQVVRDLAAALERLAQDDSLVQSMGLAGQRRIRETYDWNQKAVVINRLYEDMLQARTAALVGS